MKLLFEALFFHEFVLVFHHDLACLQIVVLEQLKIFLGFYEKASIYSIRPNLTALVKTRASSNSSAP